jgi:hypothetical protein
MYLEDVLKVIDLTRQEKIRATLSSLRNSATGMIMEFLDNLMADSRVPQEVWNALVVSLETAPAPNSDPNWAQEVMALLRDCFAKSLKPSSRLPRIPSRLPVGPPIHDLAPAAFGRIMSLTYLKSWWNTYSAIATNPLHGTALPKGKSTWSMIRALARTDGMKRLPTSILSNLPLGVYIMWSTFDEFGSGPDPFHPRPSKILELVSVLGLDPVLLGFHKDDEYPSPDSETGPLCVLLRYKLPSDLLPHVPTVVEAYAGRNRMNYYFRVTDGEICHRHRRYPRTRPSPRTMDLRGHPEVVHAVVCASELTDPLEVHRYE